MAIDEQLEKLAATHRKLLKVFKSLHESGTRLEAQGGLYKGSIGGLVEDRYFDMNFAGSCVRFVFTFLPRQGRGKITCAMRDPINPRSFCPCRDVPFR